MIKSIFLEKSKSILSQIYEFIHDLPCIDISEFNPQNTALIILDMVNGFTKFGELYSPRNGSLITPISLLSKKCSELGIVKLAFADTHTSECPEFNSYPPHCIEGTAECEIVDEIDVHTVISKNSTNGFLETEFQNWLKSNESIDTFIVVGNCTDICVYQFVTTLKAHFNRENKNSNIYVAEHLTNTFDGGMHNADLLQIMSLFSMSNNGINIVKDVKFPRP